MPITSPRATAVAFSGVPTTHRDTSEHLRMIAEAVNLLMRGKSNNTGSFTLTANAASTTVTDPRVSPNTRVHAVPTTANAQADYIAASFLITPGDGTFAVTHANDADADKIFVYSLIG